MTCIRIIKITSALVVGSYCCNLTQCNDTFSKIYLNDLTVTIGHWTVANKASREEVEFVWQ